MAEIKHFRDLRIYGEARKLAKLIYEKTKAWPKEERYSLIDQIRRSSRSVFACIAEAWRKRRYAAHFVSKLSDADMEAGETQAWLDAALDCGHLSLAEHEELDTAYEVVIGGLVKMMNQPEKWCGPGNVVKEEGAEYTT